VNKLEEVKRNYWYLGLSETFRDRFINTTVLVRARNKKGRYVADDKTTKKVNEAYVSIPRQRT